MKIWRRLSALVVVATLGCWFGVGSVACGGPPTPCDEALDKVEQCGVQDQHLTPAGDACEAIAQCQAHCVLKADCRDIVDAVEGLQNEVVDCAGACG